MEKKQSRWRVVGRFFAIAAVAYVGVVILFYAIQRMLLFPGGGPVDIEPRWEYEDVRLEVPGGATHGWYNPVENARGTVIMSHGNGENIASSLFTVEMFREIGCNVLTYDYGGYGNSTGSTTEERIYADIEAMYDWLVETKGESPARIVIYGRSLGGGASTHIASERECAALILESTFASVPDVAAHHFPWLPVRLLVKDRLESIKRIDRVTAPVLVMHSPDDSLVPFSNGQRLFEAANEPKTFVEIRGDHNEGFIISGGTIQEAIGNHLEQVLPSTESGHAGT